jgi:hypothetical protein
MTTVNVPTRVIKEPCYYLSPLSEIAGYKKEATKPGNFLSNYIQTAQTQCYCTVLCLNKFCEYHNTKHILTFVASTVNNTDMAVMRISEVEIEIKLMLPCD